MYVCELSASHSEEQGGVVDAAPSLSTATDELADILGDLSVSSSLQTPSTTAATMSTSASALTNESTTANGNALSTYDYIDIVVCNRVFKKVL